ncbi:MAG: hypothetical protein WCT77_01980 [Bacteroidota bacterium]
MAKVILTINDEVMSHLSDETREMFFDTLRYMALESYSNNTGLEPDIDEMDIESYEVDIKVVAHFEDDGTLDDYVNELERNAFFSDENNHNTNDNQKEFNFDKDYNQGEIDFPNVDGDIELLDT